LRPYNGSSPTPLTELCSGRFFPLSGPPLVFSLPSVMTLPRREVTASVRWVYVHPFFCPSPSSASLLFRPHRFGVNFYFSIRPPACRTILLCVVGFVSFRTPASMPFLYLPSFQLFPSFPKGGHLPLVGQPVDPFFLSAAVSVPNVSFLVVGPRFPSDHALLHVNFSFARRQVFFLFFF